VKATDRAGVMATFVSAILSLILPASAMAADDVRPPHRHPAPFYGRSNDRPRADMTRDDPIMKYRSGPGDPQLVVPKFHVTLGSAGKIKHPHAGSATLLDDVPYPYP
jgi:hypothetical protein